MNKFAVGVILISATTIGLLVWGALSAPSQPPRIVEGSIVVHKLTGDECLVRKIGACLSWATFSCDYDKLVCVTKDGTANDVYESEYKLKEVTK